MIILAPRKQYFLIFILIILILFVGCQKEEFKSERVELEKFKKVTVGEKLPSFTIALKEEESFDSTNYVGEFVIIFISSQVFDEFEYPIVFDKEHGKFVQPILDNNGYLLSVCDFKFAKYDFGIETINTNRGFRLKDSLLIIADSESRITKLYKNVKLGDLKEIINNLDEFIVE